MAWESRGAQTYYYRSVKRGGRVSKVYMGKGPFVAMLVAEVEQERAARQAKAEAWKQTRTDMEALDAQVTAWWNAGTPLIDAALRTQGFYRHKRGEWRKRGARQSHVPRPAEPGRAGG